jgi:hypothetical protein
MFSYRLFVPYLPALIAALLPDRRRPQRSVALIVPAILLLQGTLALIIYFGTVNPSLAARSEYRHESLRSYATFTRVLRAQAGDIARDWRRRQIDRPPRVYTYAEGVGPYYFPDEYVYGPLVSYRFDCHYDVRVTADYLQVIVPRHGTLEQQLPDWSQLTLISEHDIEFDGSRQRFLVYFRRAARPNLLPSTVAGACDGKPGRLARAEGNAERDNS